MGNLIRQTKTPFFGLLLAALVGLFAVYVTWPIYFDNYITPTPSGQIPVATLDKSWLILLNWLNVHEMTWGKDLVFTYGPLAYLTTRFGWGVNPNALLAYDCLIALNFFLIFFLILKEARNKVTFLLLAVTFLFLFPTWPGQGYAIIPMAFLLFWIRRSMDDLRIEYYAMQIILLTLMFFIKLIPGSLFSGCIT